MKYKKYKKRILIVAELSANHNNDFKLAVETIKAMAASGADAVKVQTYMPESLTINVKNKYFRKREKGLWKGFYPWEIYKKGAMPYEWQPKLKKLSEDLGLIFFSSPFDKDAVDFLEKINVPMYKIASFEITDIPLIKYAASKGKPMIISTGVAEKKDIREAIKACHSEKNFDITLLKCTSDYPSNIKKANICTMVDIKDRFDVKIGVSDHSVGEMVPIVAASLGATIIEKHFILSRKINTLDSLFSMEPDEFKRMVEAVRTVETILGEINYQVSEEDRMRRKSIFAIKDIKKGEKFTEKNIGSIRSGFGILPKYYDKIIGKKSDKNIKKGQPLKI